MNKLTGTILTLPKMSGNVGAKTIYIGGKGDDGATFIPYVSDDCVLSWTNDKDLPNPEPVNIKGAKGDKGDKGDRGQQGDKGDQGIQGIQGEPGQKGDKGDKGDTGPQGIPGEKGDTGATGKTAYAYAQDGGYTGTEEEFAAKLASEAVSAPADWNAAEGEPGHVLNRTHYTERVITDIVPTKVIQLRDGLYTEAGLWEFVVGESYVVTFQGEQYECVAFESTFMGMQTVSVGNEALYGGSNNTGEPFAAARIPDMEASGVIAPVEICTIGIAGVKDVVHPLDDKYINNEVKLTLHTGSCSKTWKEIVAALDAKKTLVAENRGWNSAFGTTVQSLRLTYCTYGATSGILVFQGFDGDVTGRLEKTTAIAQVGYVIHANNGEIKSVEEFESYFDPSDGLRNPYPLTINGTAYDGSKAVTIESIKGDTGQRGTGLLSVTTAPESYTNAVGGITPKYRMSLSTIKTQAGVTEVLLGDTVRSSYYHYPIAYLDSSYAYFTTRISIRGATGAAGTSVTVTDVAESTADGGSNVVTFSDGTTLTVKNGSKGSSGESTESIPDYVRAEAERVAKVVQSRQNADTITFIAASDFHYSTKVSNAAQQKESLTHMGQAMELIRKKVHIDFTVSCGDMVHDSGETVDEALAAMRFVSECLQNGPTDLRTRGNHDCLYSNATGLTDAQIFANVGAWNSGAQYDPDNRLGGYCYRDFDDVKIRVICLNSAETDSGGCLFSTKQVAWLTNALNLSEKGEGWRSLVVSHHPLDWGKDGGGNPITAINSATGVIAAFHGHLHNFKVGTITSTDIKRIAIPNACVGRENEYTTAYGINWGEDTKYTKTAGTASDTSFCVITIDRAACKIYADHYGAGYDREVEYVDTGDSGGSSYVNAVDTAEADDSTDLYNGTGYKVDVYCSSNGGDADDTACIATGNMLYNWAKDNPIYIKGAKVTDASHVRIYGYSTKGAAPLSSASCSGPTMSTYFTMEELETGNYYKLTPKGNLPQVKYLRLSLIDTGNKPIVSFGKPIE